MRAVCEKKTKSVCKKLFQVGEGRWVGVWQCVGSGARGRVKGVAPAQNVPGVGVGVRVTSLSGHQSMSHPAAAAWNCPSCHAKVFRSRLEKRRGGGGGRWQAGRWQAGRAGGR